MPANPGASKYRFQLRQQPPGEYTEILDASESVHKWKKGIPFFIKPEDTSRDHTALTMCDGKFFDRLMPMPEHKKTRHFGTFYMLWSCKEIDPLNSIRSS